MSTFLKTAATYERGAKTLPGHFFTSPETFRLEGERIFARRWLCAGRAERIAKPGYYFLRDILGESVIITRDRSGEARVFYNVCRHRGSRLCTESNGCFANTIQCPYHAWTYGLDGGLLGAPSMDGVDGFDKGEFPLHAVAVAQWEGFLFLNLAKEPEPFERAFAPLIGRFARFNMPRLTAQRRIDYDLKANWKLIFENYSECYHCPIIHPDLVKLTPAESGENDLTSGPFLGGFMALPKAGSMSKSGRACSLPVGDLPEEDVRRVYYYTIFPNMLLSLHPDYVMVHTLWPVAHDRTLIECEWLFHPDAAKQPGFDADDAVAFWDEVNRQDWHACELSQLGVSSRAYSPSPYSPRESLSAAFDREVVRAMHAEIG